MKTSRSIIASLVLVCIFAILFISLLSPASSPVRAQGGATEQQQTIQALVDQRFTQTATAQQQIQMTQTAFENTIDAAFNAALTATAQSGHPSVVTSQFTDIPAGTTTDGPSGLYPTAFPYLGDTNAPVKIEEIGSISCPTCLAYHQQTFLNLLDEMRAGRLEFIFLPTTETGNFDAVPGTKAAYCAMQQGKFWPMLDLLFEGQDKYAEDAGSTLHIAGYAQQAGLDGGQFYTCYSGPHAAQFVSEANTYANQRGLVGAPTIFIYVNGQQMMPGQQSQNETPGNMSGLSLPDLRHIIDTEVFPSASPFPSDTPTTGPTLNTAAFDMRSAKLYKSDNDILEMQVPAGWQTTVNPPADGTSSWVFSYGGTDPQDALLAIQIQISDAVTAYQNLDSSGKSNSPATALQALIDANSTPQPGAPALTFGTVQPVKVGALNGEGIIVDVPASPQGAENKYDLRLALVPGGKAVFVEAHGDVSLWDHAVPVIDKMLDSLVIKPQHIPTPTATSTLYPLLITATALQNQFNSLTPNATPTAIPTATPPVGSGAAAGAAAVGTPILFSDGLQYTDITLGTGDTAGVGDTVDVSYTGTLDDGTLFDTSNGKTPPYIEFQLGTGQVIKGWDEGIVGMKVGGERRLTIPPALAYGSAGQGPIPPNATLHFDVRLIAVK